MLEGLRLLKLFPLFSQNCLTSFADVAGDSLEAVTGCPKDFVSSSLREIKWRIGFSADRAGASRDKFSVDLERFGFCVSVITAVFCSLAVYVGGL